MKFGDKITHNGIEAVLVEDTNCTDCWFNHVSVDCALEGLINKCIAQNSWDDDGIFKKVEEEQK